jgi:1D-myo-inositol-triphosphate 3-kinase
MFGDELNSTIFYFQVIGSSLLFVHDAELNVNIWMIDFAKTMQAEDGLQLTHRTMWQEGNHEDGYLFGLDNMISIWSDV